jgi:hypothetical protein
MDWIHGAWNKIKESTFIRLITFGGLLLWIVLSIMHVADLSIFPSAENSGDLSRSLVVLTKLSEKDIDQYKLPKEIVEKCKAPTVFQRFEVNTAKEPDKSDTLEKIVVTGSRLQKSSDSSDVSELLSKLNIGNKVSAAALEVLSQETSRYSGMYDASVAIDGFYRNKLVQTVGETQIWELVAEHTCLILLRYSVEDSPRTAATTVFAIESSSDGVTMRLLPIFSHLNTSIAKSETPVISLKIDSTVQQIGWDDNEESRFISEPQSDSVEFAVNIGKSLSALTSEDFSESGLTVKRIQSESDWLHAPSVSENFISDCVNTGRNCIAGTIKIHIQVCEYGRGDGVFRRLQKMF